jgi:hypothetical protein
LIEILDREEIRNVSSISTHDLVLVDNIIARNPRKPNVSIVNPTQTCSPTSPNYSQFPDLFILPLFFPIIYLKNQIHQPQIRIRPALPKALPLKQVLPPKILKLGMVLQMTKPTVFVGFM